MNLEPRAILKGTGASVEAVCAACKAVIFREPSVYAALSNASKVLEHKCAQPST